MLGRDCFSRANSNPLLPGGRVLAAGAIGGVFAVAGLSAAVACNGGPDGCAGFRTDAAITISVGGPNQQVGIATAQGACAAPVCITPVAAGCAVWQATQTGETGDPCKVRLVFANDAALEKVVYDQHTCGGYISQHVQF